MLSLKVKLEQYSASLNHIHTCTCAHLHSRSLSLHLPQPLSLSLHLSTVSPAQSVYVQFDQHVARCHVYKARATATKPKNPKNQSKQSKKRIRRRRKWVLSCSHVWSNASITGTVASTCNHTRTHKTPPEQEKEGQRNPKRETDKTARKRGHDNSVEMADAKAHNHPHTRRLRTKTRTKHAQSTHVCKGREKGGNRHGRFKCQWCPWLVCREQSQWLA